MKVTAVKENGLAHEYRVTVAASEVEKQLVTELQSISKKAKVHGFRPGKIPMDILKQRYGKDVMDSVLWETINKSMRDLIAEKSLRPAMKPDVKIVEYEESGDLIFDLSLETLPDAPELDFDKITVTDYEFEVPQDEQDEALKRLAISRKHLHEAPADEKAKLGDAVKIDFVGSRDGVPFPGGAGNDFQLELGAGQFIPGFEDQLVGAKAGDERTVKVTFPEEYHSPDLAGQKAEFAVTVKSVHRVHVPELNEKLAKELKFESLDKLKEAVHEQIAADYQAIARSKSKKELFDWLDNKVKFEVPSQMLKLEFEGIWKQLQEAKQKGDSTLDKPEAELRKEYEAISERRVRLGILLAELGRKNNIQVTRDELTRAVVDQARMFPGHEKKIFEFYQNNPQHVEELKGPIIEEKVVDFILSKVKRKKKSVTIPELMAEDNADKAEGGAAAKASSDSEKKAPAKKKAADKK